MIRLWMFPLATILALAVPVGAAQGQEGPLEQNDGKRVVLAQDFVPLPDVLELCAFLKKRPILWEKGQVEGEVRVQRGTTLDSEGMWQLAVNSLAMKGLAIVQTPQTSALQIVEVEKAASLARLESPDLAGAEAGFLKVVVHLQELAADKAELVVKHVLSGRGSKVEAIVQGNALLIADFAPQLGQAVELVAMLDVPDAAPEIVEIELERADPTTLAALIGQIKAKESAVAGEALLGEILPLAAEKSLLVIAPPDEVEYWRSLILRFDRQQALVTEHYQPRRFGLEETAQLIEEVVHGSDSVLEDDSWRMVIDQLTGILIVTATPARQREVTQLLARLESTGTEARRPMRTFPVRNRQVSEVLGLSSVALRAGIDEECARAMLAELMTRHISQFGSEEERVPWDDESLDAAYLPEIIIHMGMLVEHQDGGELFEIREHPRYHAVEGARVKFWESDDRTWNGSLLDISEMGLLFEVRIEAPDSEQEPKEGESDPHEGLDTTFELIPPSGPTNQWSRIPGTVIRRTREWGNLTYRVRLAKPVPPDLLNHLRGDRP